MAEDKPGGSDLKAEFVFVKHGDPLPTAWMAAHPGWVRFPATLVPRPDDRVRHGARLPPPDALPGSLEGGTARPVAMGAPMVQRPGLRNRGRPPRYPGRSGPEDGGGGGEDPVAAYLRVNGSLAAMGLMEPVAAWRNRHPHRTHTASTAEVPATAAPAAAAPDVGAGLGMSAEGLASSYQQETQGCLDGMPRGLLDDVSGSPGATPDISTNVGDLYQQVIGSGGVSGYNSMLTASRIINPSAQVKSQEESGFEHLIALQEGYRNDVFLDNTGKPTVGIGHFVKSSDI